MVSAVGFDSDEFDERSGFRTSDCRFLNTNDCTVMKIAHNTLQTDVQANLKVDFGPGGSKVSTSVSGQVQDSHGNYLNAQIQKNSDGTGSVSASVGHKTPPKYR